MKKQGIYFLYLDEELIYIGKTINLKNRLSSHDRIGRVFDKYSFIEVENQSDMAILELAYIDKYKPSQNKLDNFECKLTISVDLEDITKFESFNFYIRLNDDKFMARGYKMYNDGVIRLFTALTKTEAIKAIELFDEKTVDRFNILVGKFSDYTSEMHKTDRSKFKKKLIDNEIIQEFNKKIMLNPYIFIPKGDNNLKNSNYLTQRVWNYLFLDCDGKSEEVERHAKLMFGENIFLESDYIKVGSKDHSKIIKKPNK